MENNIRKLRQESGLSVQELADKIGGSVAMLMKIETGERNLSNDWIKRFCKAFNVPAQALSDDPDYVFKTDNLDKMIKPINDEPEQNAVAIQDGQEIEMLRIFRTLDYKGKAELLLFGYKLEKGETE